MSATCSAVRYSGSDATSRLVGWTSALAVGGLPPEWVNCVSVVVTASMGLLLAIWRAPERWEFGISVDGCPTQGCRERRNDGARWRCGSPQRGLTRWDPIVEGRPGSG